MSTTTQNASKSRRQLVPGSAPALNPRVSLRTAKPARSSKSAAAEIMPAPPAKLRAAGLTHKRKKNNNSSDSDSAHPAKRPNHSQATEEEDEEEEEEEKPRTRLRTALRIVESDEEEDEEQLEGDYEDEPSQIDDAYAWRHNANFEDEPSQVDVPYGRRRNNGYVPLVVSHSGHTATPAGRRVLSPMPTRDNNEHAAGNNSPTPVSAPQTPSRATLPAGDYTPYEPKINPRDPSKPLWNDTTPDTRSIVELGSKLYVNEAMTTDPFLDDPTSVKLADKNLHCAAVILQLPRRADRLKSETVFLRDCRKMVKGRVSTKRSQTVNEARLVVGQAFKLTEIKVAAEIKTRVARLRENDAYIFKSLIWDEHGNIIKRIGAYQKDELEMLIFNVFFVGYDKPALAEHTRDLFKPIPLSVIAFAATAIECALVDWSEGVHLKASTQFTADNWSPIYERHLRALKKIHVAKKDKVEEMCMRIWTNCWSMTEAAVAHVDDDEDDMALTQGEIDEFELV